MTEYIYLAFSLLLCPLLFENIRYEFMFFQQNSYKFSRYLKSISKANVKRYSIHLVCLGMAVFAYLGQGILIHSLLLLFSFVLFYFRIKRKYKKPFVYTARMKRLMSVNILLIIGGGIIVYIYHSSGLFLYMMAVLFLASPLLLLSNLLLMPLEMSIASYYYRDAKRILKSHKNLKIIAITGSYGKTSTKHYLYRILSENYNVLMTPGNFNTTLGVILSIRNHLQAFHDIFIVEMGAKQLGDIQEICRLVNPSIGIITAIGEQHLESFKSIENVQKTKFELLDSLPQTGFAVLNKDYPFIENRDNSLSRVKDIEYYSMENKSEKGYGIDQIRFENGKTVFSIYYQGVFVEEMSTRLLGKYNLSNLLACYIVAKHLNCSSESIFNAVKDIYPVEHRLSLRYLSGNISILDDAYNSNPKGAEMALEVLGQYPGNKKIIISPGMIELGSKQYEINKEFGSQMAKYCTDVFLVGQYNRQAILEGLQEAGFDLSKVHSCANLKEAVEKMNRILSSGDVVLYENDLPDTFH